MKTSFVVIFTFLLLQRFGSTITTTSSNVTCVEDERRSLLAFKHKLTDNFNLLSTWRGVECCEWRGVGCDSRKGHVVKLDLRSPDSIWSNVGDQRCLEGELSPSLQNLGHLRYLDLSLNYFSGNIPKYLGSFERLEYLNLSGSSFWGVVPHHLGNLSRLQYLDLRSRFYFKDEGIIFRAPVLDDLRWVSSLSSLRYLDFTGLSIVNHTDWFHPINMLPSLHTLNLASCDIKNIPSVKNANFTSLNSLDLSRNHINSTIPVWLSNLTSLMLLNLYENSFHGKIPEFIGTFSALASMNLAFNSFETSMPDLLCNLSSLVRLDLSRNMFTGSIPASLGQLMGLKELKLGDNQLSGKIPTSLGQLSRLEELKLAYNELSGNIPMSLGKLSKLKNLDLSRNSLVGVLSETHFLNLKNLNYLHLSWNWGLALNFSYGWIPPFQLQEFHASSCNIGPNFPNWLPTQTNLQSLYLSNSSVRDTLPGWFENILSNIHVLDLSHNQIGGKLPRFHTDSSNQIMKMLIMNSNKFNGSLSTFPKNVIFLDLSENLLSGDLPQIDGTMNRRSLEEINLSKNHFTGSIPVDLCKVLSIEVLDLSQNKLSGRLPECLGNLINMEVIDVSNNSITGVVPSSLGSLTQLLSLHLHNNRFEGNLPISLQNLTSLVTMDIGYNSLVGCIPFWIGENLSNLRILNLQSNKFTGKIPLQLCQLNALHYLNLAQNKVTGSIPCCFVNLSGMINYQDNIGYTVSYYEENTLASMKGIQLLYTKTISFLTSLDLSNNNITGEIPDALVNLVGLKNLNLSRNQLRGHIPMEIGNLNQMESLDLSMNMLSGRIPQSLSSLNFLSYLNLSFNNLSGPIPVGNQLQTLANPSVYEGNNELCGPQISKTCKVNNSLYNHVDKVDAQDDDEGLWFYVSMGLGFVVGFLGLVGSLHFIRRWRLAYFEMLENVYGWLSILILLNLARLRRTFF